MDRDRFEGSRDSRIHVVDDTKSYGKAIGQTQNLKPEPYLSIGHG
jgi:hypothetical protein